MFYRGASLAELNADEFGYNEIDGEEVPVYEAEFPEGVDAGDHRNQEIHNIEEYITDSYEAAITGGLTDTLPAAIKFTKDRFPPGLVLIMDETNIATSVQRVQYAPAWFDAHPGVLAHVTTLHEGELREGGGIVALLSVREDKTVIFETRRGEIENEATASRVTTEDEFVAFDDSIRLDDAVTAVVMYRGTTGTSPYTLSATINDMPGYSARGSGVKNLETREYISGEDKYRTQAEIVYEETKEMVQYDTSNLFLVAVGDMNDVSADTGHIEPDNFRFVYNGRGFDESYERNSHLLGGL